MNKTVYQPSFKWHEIFDEEKGKPRFIRPYSLTPSTLRVTSEEWYEICNSTTGRDGCDSWGVFLHSRFTMITEMYPCRTRVNKHEMPYIDAEGEKRYPAAHDLAISIACPFGTPNAVVFGPYDRGEDRALGKATDYLVKNKILILVNMPDGVNAGEWMMQERLRIRDGWFKES